MKKLILTFAFATNLGLSSLADDVKPLTQEQIDRILEQAEQNGDLSSPDVSVGERAAIRIIRPDGINMFSDMDVHCNNTKKHSDEPTLIPLNDEGMPDADQLPDHCSLRHKTVARPHHDTERKIIRALPNDAQTDKQLNNLSEADTVDEPTFEE